MIALKNITFDEYLCLENRDEYDFAIKYAIPFLESKDILNIGDFMQLEFGLIKDLQQDMSKDMDWKKLTEYMVLISGKPIEFFCKLSLLNVCLFKNRIISELKRIIEIENIALHYDPTDEEIAAGIDSFNVFGVYSQLLFIAGNNPLNIEHVRKMKYEEAFVYMVYQKTKNDFESKLYELRSKRAE